MTSIITRLIFPLSGFEKLERAEGPVRTNVHNRPHHPEGTPEQLMLNRGPVREAAERLLQLRKKGLHGDTYPDNLEPTFYGLGERGTDWVQHALPAHPFLVASEAGAHMIAWPGDKTRLLMCFGARVLRPGASMPAFPDGANWRKALRRSTNMDVAIMAFVFDRHEGAHLAVNAVHYAGSPKERRAVGFSAYPEWHRRELQAEWEELMDSTDWRGGPAFTAQRWLNRIEGANTP